MASNNATGSSSTKNSVQEIILLWDLNSCPFGPPPTKLVENIEKALKELHALDPSGYLKYREEKELPKEEEEVRALDADEYLENRFEKELHVLDREYRLSKTKIVCGDLENLEEDIVRTLTSQDFQLFHCKERLEAKTDSTPPTPEFQITDSLYKCVLQNASKPQNKKNILLISGDYKFKPSLDYLYGLGYTIFLAIPKDCYTIYPYFTWNWESMQLGGPSSLIKWDELKFASLM